jgi:uncharacterized protein (TIGR02594 family)
MKKLGIHTYEGMDKFQITTAVKHYLEHVNAKWITEDGKRPEPGNAGWARNNNYKVHITYWCSAFVNWCMEEVRIQGTGNAAASSWLKWGKHLSTPKLGCVTIMRRSGGNHVGFYIDSSAHYITLLGGNQGNEVKISHGFHKNDLRGYRWPPDVAKLDMGIQA